MSSHRTCLGLIFVGTASVAIAGSPLQDRADAAALEKVTCQYEAFRKAHDSGVTNAQFPTFYDRHCQAERERSRTATIEAMVAHKGISRAEATRRHAELQARLRARMIEQYRTREELAAQLRAIEQAAQQGE